MATVVSEPRGTAKRSHFFAVANQHDIAGQHRVIPGFALNRLEAHELSELAGGRPYQRQLTLLRQHARHARTPVWRRRPGQRRPITWPGNAIPQNWPKRIENG